MKNAIFNSEIFKITHDQGVNILTLVNGIVNIVVTIGWVIFVKSGAMQGSASNAFSISILVLLPLLTIAGLLTSAVVFYLVPFRSISVDYGNSLLQLSIASGTSRTRYYFSKLTVTALRMMVTFVFLITIPTIIILASTDGSVEWLTNIINSLGIWEIVFVPFIGYLSLIALIYLAVVLMKGSLLSILVAIGINFGASLIMTPIQIIIQTSIYNSTVQTSVQAGTLLWWAILQQLITLTAYTVIGWQVFKHQDL
ncbi:MAG: hypothetical protein LBM27_06540 [Lactobacillaceae bacterium]|jgi:hypothetical protein|nr:hypothetical protein [Lactobacillaceae bacterium]